MRRRKERRKREFGIGIPMMHIAHRGVATWTSTLISTKEKKKKILNNMYRLVHWEVNECGKVKEEDNLKKKSKCNFVHIAHS